MTVGMAFAYFAEQNVDIAVIEVGLGGRLDSTNIITPEICLITNIGYDHQQILGNTLPQIGLEKAGIIKAGVPVVIGQKQNEVAGLFQMMAARKNAELTFANPDLGKEFKTDLKGKVSKVQCSRELWKFCADCAGFSISEKHIANGLQKVVPSTGLLGRWQVLQESPKVICDTGHNVDGIRYLMKQLNKEKCEQLHIVWGMVVDKSLDTILPLLPHHARYYFVQPQIPRALSAKALANAAEKQLLEGSVYPNVREGYEAALAAAGPERPDLCGREHLCGRRSPLRPEKNFIFFFGKPKIILYLHSLFGNRGS